MITIKGRKFNTIDDLHKKSMRDPEYRKAYEALRPKFAKISAKIEAKIKKKRKILRK